MTGGVAVLLGPTGKNLAAGMSGGIAYVLDEHHDLYRRINKEMVSFGEITEKEDKERLHAILKDYAEATGSKKAAQILEQFEEKLPYFKKIVPIGYSRMLKTIAKYEAKGVSHDTAVLEAFEEIAKEG